MQHKKRPAALDAQLQRSSLLAGSLPPWRCAEVLEHAVPDWFSHAPETPIDVSVIVPMHNSRARIQTLIDSWVFPKSGLAVEVIHIDDGCPEKSGEIVVPTWAKKLGDGKRPVGRVVANQQICGFGRSCNIGARLAQGAYVLFLNADTRIVDPDWIDKLVAVMEQNDRVSVVAPMIISQNGAVDSVGSEWSWSKRRFLHVGKEVHEGSLLQKAFFTRDMPKKLAKAGEREATTGACMLVRRDEFLMAEGFDENYRVGYWEDSDLCLKMREDGGKVVCVPDSTIIHYGGHSGASTHPWVGSNAGLFDDKWVKTGRIDRLIHQDRIRRIQNRVPSKKTVACVVVRDDEFMEPCIESLRAFVCQWIFVPETIDRSSLAKDIAENNGGTYLEPPVSGWRNLSAIRNKCLSMVSEGNWVLWLDGDEVFKKDQLSFIGNVMPNFDVISMSCWTFWNNVDTVATGIWEQYPQERMVRAVKGCHYSDGQWLHARVGGRMACQFMRHFRTSDRLFFHYSWVRPLPGIERRLKRFNEETGVNVGDYLTNTFLKWREQPAETTGRTHPYMGGNYVQFNGIHPWPVQRRLEDGELNF